MNTELNKKCFTIMPFSVRNPDLPRYYNDSNHWNEVYHGLIVPAVKEAGLHCERDDEDASTRLITENIWRKIEEVDIVLCDLSAHNPNVYLELGWTLRADKRFILIKDDVTQFNFDLNQFYTYQYSHRLQPSSLRQAITELANVIKTTLADENRRYSMVHKLAIQLQAMKAASEGNIEISLLRELITEVRSSVGSHRGTLTSWNQPRFFFPQIKTQADLGKMLVGTTWRKRNNVEHVIFSDENSFYNNHAGHPKWRKNSYTLGERLGTMTLVYRFNKIFTLVFGKIKIFPTMNDGRCINFFNAFENSLAQFVLGIDANVFQKGSCHFAKQRFN